MSIRRVSRYETPWGAGLVWVSDGQLVAVELPDTREPVAVASAPGPSAPQEVSESDQAALEQWVAELEAYFRGERLAWSLEELSLEALSLGPFARSVYEVLLSVPPGETVAYGELAEMAGYPRAARAVGNVMAANPIPVVVPCHRVIRADGSLGNYGDDPAWKSRLLEHERAEVPTS
jgi:methylated-DNA-[protein]-cysteine S-methyltransferase